MLLLSSAAFFPKINFSKNSFTNTIRVFNSLDPEYSVHSDLGLNCLQRLSADDKSRRLQGKS